MSEPTRNEMILGLFDRPIAFHRPLVTITGSVTAALLLSQAIYWQRRTTSEDGWFWKTQKEWEEETGLGRREQEAARRRLSELKLLLEERRGVPAKMFFKVNEEGLNDLLLGVDHFTSAERMIEIFRPVLRDLSKLGFERAKKAGVHSEFVDYEQILKRDKAICHVCGNQIRFGPGQKPGCLQFDHVIPIDAGGSHNPENLKTAHVECNLRKGAQSSLSESDKLDGSSRSIRFGSPGHSTNTETTSETTSKNPSQPDGAKLSEGEGKGDGKPDADKSAKETHREFIELWTESFEMQFGRKYVFQGGKDGQALKRLIAAAKMSAGELMGVATNAWTKNGKRFERDFWNCQRAVTITDFCSRFNQILDELNRNRNAIPIQKPPGVEDDHEARYGFKRGVIPLSQRPPPGEDEAGNKISRQEWEERFPLSLYDHDK